MARGFLSGVMWGGVVGLGLTGVASVIAPLPSAPLVSDVAPGAAAAPARVEQASSGERGSQSDPKLITPQTTPQAQAPESETAPALDTAALSPAQQPQAGAADTLQAPSSGAESAAVDVDQDTPVLPNPLALAPMEPQAADDLAISTEPAARPAPSKEKVEGVFAAPALSAPDEGGQGADTAIALAPNDAGVSAETPQTLATPANPGDTASLEDSTIPVAPTEVAQDTAPAAQPVIKPVDQPTGLATQSPEVSTPLEQVTETDVAVLEAPQADARPAEALAPQQPTTEPVETAQTAPTAPVETEPEQAATNETETADVDQTQTQQGAASATVLRPRIGTPSISLTDRTTGVTINRLTNVDAKVEEEEPTANPEPSLSGQPPVKRYIQGFENAENKPLMSILLIDDGSSPVSGAAGIEALRNFPYPLSFAVDTSLSDAADRMAIYRAEGMEVMAMIDLPEGAQPSDAETTLGAILPAMNEVVGVLEGTQGGLQGSRDVADQVTAILAQTGHGLITQDRGLNTMPKLARKAGVPADPVFRDFDSKGQSAQVIRRFLDQAAFKAGQEGAVVMLGRLRPDTISALMLWGLQDRAGKVALAPISAVLNREE